MPVLGKQVDRPNSQFLFIPLSRYIIMSVVTFGIYQVYWIYKNWEYLKNRDNLNIHPFWRGIFGIFTVHELLGAIHDDPILNKNKSAQFNPFFLATGWVIIVFIRAVFNGMSKNFNADFAFLFILVLLVIQLTFFIPVQRYINEVNARVTPAPAHYPWSAGHFVMIGLIVAIFMVGVFSAVSSNSGSSTTTYNTVTTYQEVESAQVFQRISYFGYSEFKNDNLHFSLNLPKDWDSYIIDSKASSSISSDKSLSEIMMPQIVYLYNKNYDASKSMVMIMGMDTTKSAWGDVSCQSMNDGFIEGIKQGLEEAQSSNIIVKSKGQSFLINGYQARGNEISYTTQNGIPSSLKIFTIKNGSKFYIIYYVATDDLYSNQIEIFEQIVGSFVPTN